MMGYTRQSVAISLGMLGLAALARARQRQFMFYALAAATFHKSAVALVPLTVLQRDRNLWITVLGACAIGVIAYWLLLHDHVNLVLKGYIEVEYKSAGALVRLVMNALPAAILLAWRSRFGLSDHEWKIWRGVAVTAIILVLLYPGFPSSVILDRLGLYLIPLQLFVYSRLPDVIGETRKSKQAWVAIILCYCALVQFVWLNFSMNAHNWIPYQFYPFAQP
ncbi:EpsG family protein [Spiribacter pallidus]|uniref:EpsG family protein n=1 Tax=Spiribacter pallidus TaxID=1987936 RepID=UPI0038B2ACF1